jgi:hypothetical protein
MQLKRTAGRFSSPRQIQRKSLSFFLVRSTALRCILGRTRCHLRWGSADSCQQCASLSTEIKDSARNRPNNKANQFLFRLLAALGNLACIMKLFGCAIIFRAQRSSPLVFFSPLLSQKNCMSLSMAKQQSRFIVTKFIFPRAKFCALYQSPASPPHSTRRNANFPKSRNMKFEIEISIENPSTYFSMRTSFCGESNDEKIDREM